MMNVFNGYKKIVSFSSKGMYSAAFKKLMDASNNVIAAPKRGKRKETYTSAHWIIWFYLRKCT